VDYIPYVESDASEITTDRSIGHQSTADLQKYLRPLNESLINHGDSADRWHRIEGPFAHVLVTSKACISKDVVASLSSTLADGYLTLQFIRSNGPTRMHLAKTFTKLAEGKHFDYDFVEWVRVRAFRIVPADASGNIMVDGEKVAYGNSLNNVEKRIYSR
jgi:hypothetical protein